MLERGVSVSLVFMALHFGIGVLSHFPSHFEQNELDGKKVIVRGSIKGDSSFHAPPLPWKKTCSIILAPATKKVWKIVFSPGFSRTYPCEPKHCFKTSDKH